MNLNQTSYLMRVRGKRRDASPKINNVKDNESAEEGTSLIYERTQTYENLRIKQREVNPRDETDQRIVWIGQPKTTETYVIRKNRSTDLKDE